MDNQKKNNQNSSPFQLAYVISFGLQLGFFIFFPIAGFLLLGLWIDTHFQTEPLFVLLGIIVSFVVSAYEVYHLILPLIDKPDA